MDIKSFRDLMVWQKAMDLVEECYRITANLPRNEEFGLKSQMRRAAVSIPSNIAEGHSRRYSKQFLQHLSISLGSLAELETLLELALRLHLLPVPGTEHCTALCELVGKMLHGLATAISHRSH